MSGNTHKPLLSHLPERWGYFGLTASAPQERPAVVEVGAAVGRVIAVNCAMSNGRAHPEVGEELPKALKMHW